MIKSMKKKLLKNKVVLCRHTHTSRISLWISSDYYKACCKCILGATNQNSFMAPIMNCCMNK